MQQPRVTFRHVILAMRYGKAPQTTGQAMFLGAIVILLLPLLLLGLFLGMISSLVLRTFLWGEIAFWSLLIGPPTALLFLFAWKFRDTARVLKAELSAGAPLPVQTKRDTAYFVVVGVGLLLLVPLAVILFLVPAQERIWVQLVWFLLIFMAQIAVGPRGSDQSRLPRR